VVFTDAYPTTATGKIRRVELREMAATVLVPGDTPTQGSPSVVPSSSTGPTAKR